jgi:predicted DsbA family dithiol-disulfide isomerase
VPFFVIDRRFGLAGAQPPEVLGEGLRRAWEAQAPLAVVAEGDVCGPDGC